MVTRSSDANTKVYGDGSAILKILFGGGGGVCGLLNIAFNITFEKLIFRHIFYIIR